MKTWPLRWRIALWSACVSAFALAAFTAIVAVNLYDEQVELIDDRLQATERLLSVQEGKEGRVDAGFFKALTKEPKSKGDAPLAGYALVRARDGRTIHAKPSELAVIAATKAEKSKPFTRVFDGKRLRFATFTWDDQTLLLAGSLEPADESVEDLLRSAAFALPMVLLVVIAGSWWIARKALKPIVQITEAAASITADRLGERLRAPATTDEIGRHVEVLNDMFDRLQRSFEQATRFTADAAHELRTPLTIMRCQVEDELRTSGLAPEMEAVLIDLLEEITGLQKISENLLLLARFDTGKNPLRCAPLDLSALLNDAVEDAELLALPKHLKIGSKIASGVRVDGDDVMLRRVAHNLIDNAVKFSRDHGEVKLSLCVERGEAVFAVGNSGPAIPPEQHAALFKRFHRVDEDRNRSSGGSGLGLSLCREIVSAHRGKIELERSSEEWTEFAVRLPITPVA